MPRKKLGGVALKALITLLGLGVLLAFAGERGPETTQPFTQNSSAFAAQAQPEPWWSRSGVPGSQVFPEPLAVVCGDENHPPDLIREIRAAAGFAVADQLNLELGDRLEALFRRPDPLLLEQLEEIERELSRHILELERIAQGPNRQCREIIDFYRSLFVLKVLFARSILSPVFSISLADLYSIRAVVQAAIAVGGATEETSLIQTAFFGEYLRQLQQLANSVKTAQSFELGADRALALSQAIPLFILFLLSPNPPDPLTELFDPQRWERVACGGKESFTLLEIEFDGSFLIASNDSRGYPFREAAAVIWGISSNINGRFSVFYDQALRGCTSELRTVAALLYLEFPQFGPPLGPGSAREIWEELALEAKSAEMRAAAASRLIPFLADDQGLSDEDLQQLALLGKTAEFRSAAGSALGFRWQQKVKISKLDLSTIISFLGPDGQTLRQGTLIQFAATHTEVHPELAQAAIAPLFLLFKAELRRRL